MQIVGDNLSVPLYARDCAVFCSSHDNDKAIGNLFQAAACISVRGIFCRHSSVGSEQLICNQKKGFCWL
jgi:hypothetical protein